MESAKAARSKRDKARYTSTTQDKADARADAKFEAQEKANQKAAAREVSTQDDSVLTQSELEIGLEMLELGYRALAKKRHPDVGGSTKAMQELNLIKEKIANAFKLAMEG